MIHYKTSSWVDILTRWRGTTVASVWHKVLCNFILASLAYSLECFLDMNLGYAFEHSGILGHTLTFLLVFRANSSYERYWQGRNFISGFFVGIRDLAFLTCTLLKGGRGQYLYNRVIGEDGYSLQRKRGQEDRDDLATSNARTDIVRWCLALAVAFRIHMRLNGDPYYIGTMEEHVKLKFNWDRMRLRTLMSKEEFEEIDRALTQYVPDDTDEKDLWNKDHGQPHAFHVDELPWHQPDRVHEVSQEPSFRQMLVVLNFVTQSVRLHSSEPYGYKERFLPEFIKLTTFVLSHEDEVNQAMTTPLPLPYVNLVRTLLVTYLLSVPFFIDYTEGLWANVGMPTITALALLGIDQIGSELENPFGEDANDLDVQEMMMTLEKELMRLLEFSGDAVARDKFTWVPVPKFMQEETERPFYWYLALAKEVQHLNIPRHKEAGGVTVKHQEAPEPRRRPGTEGAEHHHHHHHHHHGHYGHSHDHRH